MVNVWGSMGSKEHGNNRSYDRTSNKKCNHPVNRPNNASGTRRHRMSPNRWRAIDAELIQAHANHLPATGNRTARIARSQSNDDLKASNVPLEYTMKLPRQWHSERNAESQACLPGRRKTARTTSESMQAYEAQRERWNNVGSLAMWA